MSFARFASNVSPLRYRPPPRLQKVNGVYLGKKYRLKGHPYTFIPESMSDTNGMVMGHATHMRNGDVFGPIAWEITKLELVEAQ